MGFSAVTARLAGLALVSLVVLAGCDTTGVSQPPSTPTTSQATPPAAATATVTVPTALPGGAGSDGGTQDGNDASRANPCKLLTQADIESVMGPVNYNPQLSVSEDDAVLFTAHECWYVNDVVLINQDNTGLHQVSLWVSTPDHWTDDRELFGPGEPVSGLGGQAFTADFNLGVGVWVLLENRAVVNVNVYPKDANFATELARKAIAKLP